MISITKSQFYFDITALQSSGIYIKQKQNFGYATLIGNNFLNT